MQEPVITLLTDFGVTDSYVGAMKGVILSICPSAKLIDLSHEIKEHDIYEGAFFLSSVAKFYPKNTIHLVVIDPGVGSERNAVMIRSENYFFIGPDNGVLSLAASVDGVKKIVKISNSKYFLKPISHTFHGRDIFAPVAAHLAKIGEIEKFGPIIKEWNQIEITKARVEKTGIHGEIIHVDRFGNLITNISQEIFQNAEGIQPDFIQVRINDRDLKMILANSYNQVKVGDYLGIFGSYNFLEISRNQASAATLLNSRVHDKILLKF